MSLRTVPSTIQVAVVEALLSNEQRDSLQEHLDVERLWKHGRRAEPVELLQGKFVRGAHDDRCCRVAQADPTYRSARAPALVWTEADEIHDHQVGSQVCRRAIQSVDEREVMALIAQYLADEVSYVAVVLDDQDVSYARQAADFRRGMQF
jgi:hypothetical protein